MRPSGLTIGYDATPAVRQRAGIGRYARQLLLALASQESNDRFRVTFQARTPELPLPDLGPRFCLRPIPISERAMNLLWQRLRLPLPIEAATGRLDVFHSPDFSLAPSIAPSIVTIHDVVFDLLPQASYPTLAIYLHQIVPRAIHRANAVIVPSAFTRDGIIRQFGTVEDKIHVIPEGVSHPFQAKKDAVDQVILAARGIAEPYLLTVSTLEPRKNLERLLRAFAIMRSRGIKHRLIIVGRRGWLYESIFRTHSELRLEDAVLFLSNAEDEELAVLYRNADITVCPSLYEGLGLPALEALACGSPVACSGNSSLPEVTGDIAAFFDPWDVEDVAGTIQALLNDTKRRRAMAKAGPKRASMFTWQRAADATARLYHDVAAAHAR